MINRILIRIKVVQMLYSYLLTRREFQIESAPDASASRDKRSAYNTYLDLLLLMIELSGYDVQGGRRLNPVPEAVHNKYLHNNKVVKSIVSDDKLRAAILRDPSRMSAYDIVAPDLFSEITKSSAYRSFIRIKEHTLKTDTDFWVAVIKTIIAPNEAFRNAVRRNGEAFTISGYERGVNMAIDTLAGFSDSRALFFNARNALNTSLEKARTLYHALLWLIVELTRAQERRLEAARNKYLPTAEDLNPNTRLVDNQFAQALATNAELEEYFDQFPFSWETNDVMLKSLLDKILASDIYREYLDSNVTDWAGDCEFWRSVMRSIILPSDELAEALEEKSVYWNDDLQIMGTFVLKTIKQFATVGPENKLLPKFKDEEDEKFGPELFVKAVDNRELYREYIDRCLKESTWDPERLAFMDVVIMTVAIAELLNYPQIPVPVTLNEYIEIANSYSTQRSGQFINGILYSVINNLRNDGLLEK